jgi:hypothetical protein
MFSETLMHHSIPQKLFKVEISIENAAYLSFLEIFSMRELAKVLQQNLFNLNKSKLPQAFLNKYILHISPLGNFTLFRFMVEMASYKSFGRFKILNSLRIYLL